MNNKIGLVAHRQKRCAEKLGQSAKLAIESSTGHDISHIQDIVIQVRDTLLLEPMMVNFIIRSNSGQNSSW
jgi:hypothetical protein